MRAFRSAAIPAFVLDSQHPSLSYSSALQDHQLLPERGELRRTVLLPPSDLASESFAPITTTPAVE
ncbi:MAG: hypothetical protein ACLGIW_20210, partial [Gammaproteobacteria bacterium]